MGVRKHGFICGFTHMWNIRNSKEDYKEREGKLNGKKIRETNHERLVTLGNKLRVARGEVGGEMG